MSLEDKNKTLIYTSTVFQRCQDKGLKNAPPPFKKGDKNLTVGGHMMAPVQCFGAQFFFKDFFQNANFNMARVFCIVLSAPKRLTEVKSEQPSSHAYYS